jgi:hypothetical protein
MPATITLKNASSLRSEKEFVLVPRREYEEFLTLKKFNEFTPKVGHRKALARAEKNLRSGKTLSYYELKEKLGLAS